MDSITAYHITDIANIKSIVRNGLVPTIGNNSRLVHEQSPLTYFTTREFIETWMRRFQLDKKNVVVLKFQCDHFGKRFDDAFDGYTTVSIKPGDLMVEGEHEISLIDFFEKHRKLVELSLQKNVVLKIQSLDKRLENINQNRLSVEDSWQYHEIDPDIIGTVDLLKIIRDLDDKDEFNPILDDLKMKTLDSFLENDLGITEQCSFYRVLLRLFEDSLSTCPNIRYMNFDILTKLLSINLYYRQLDRYKRTKKKVGDDNRVWDYDSLFPEVQDSLCEDFLKELMEETTLLYKNSFSFTNK